MALNVGTLSAKLGLDSTSFLGSLGGAKAALIGLGAVAAVVGLGVKAVFDIGSEVDDARDAIRIGTGAMGENLDDLLESAQRIGTEVPRNLDEIAPALADVNTRLGLTGGALEGVTAQFLELARMNETEVGPQVENGARLFGDWGVAAEDMEATLDRLFKVSQNTGIGTERLSQITTDYGATLRGMGFSLDDALSLMGKWEKEGVNTEAILGGMKIGLNNLAADASDTASELEGIPAGLAAMNGLSTKIKEPADAFRDVQLAIKNAKTDTEAFAIAADTFGSRAGADMAMAIREGRFELEDLQAALDGSSETILGAAEDTHSLGEKWAMFSNRIENKIAPIALKFYDMLGTGLDKILPVVEGAIDFITGLFGGLGETTGDTTGKFGEMLSRISEIMGQIGEVIASVVGFVSDIWTEHGEEIMAIVSSMMDAIWQIIGGALDVIIGILDVFIGIFSGDWSRVKDGVVSIVTGLKNIVLGVFQAMWDRLRLAVVVGKAVLFGLFSGAVNSLVGLARTGWNAITSWFSDMWAKIKTAAIEKWADLSTWWSELPGKILEAIGDLGGLLFNVGKSILEGLWNGLKSKWDDVAGWVGGLGSKIADLKGPISADRLLLIPQGEAIMDGLNEGFRRRFGAVEGTLSGLTGRIANGSLSAGRVSGGGAGMQTLIFSIDGREMARLIKTIDYDETTLRLGSANRY